MDVFFAISGYVITGMLMRELGTTGGIRIGRFYLRRFKRLTPGLSLVLVVVITWSFLLLGPFGLQQTVAQTAIGATLLAANAVIARAPWDYFDASAETNPLLHTWSLSVEEQYYLLFPALLLSGVTLGRRVVGSDRTAFIVIGLTGLTSLTLVLAHGAGAEIPLVPDFLSGFYSPAMRAWEFAAGALVALGRGGRADFRVSAYATVVGAVMLVSSFWLIDSETQHPGLWTLLPVAGTLLIIASGSSDIWIQRALASRPMVAVGDRSYAIYLWHWPFVSFAHILRPDSALVGLSAAAFSFVPAYASYKWVEQPLRDRSTPNRSSLIRLVSVILAPPIVLAGALGFAARNSYWNVAVEDLKQSITPYHAGYVANCTNEAWTKVNDCIWNGEAEGRPIYLVGDSNADHFIEGVIGAAVALDRPLISLSEGGCSYYPGLAPSPVKQQRESCERYPDSTEKVLLGAEPGLVILANSYLQYVEGAPEATGPSDFSNGPEPKMRDLHVTLVNAVSTLQDYGHVVLLVQAIPQWGATLESLTWDACPTPRLLTVGCNPSMPLEEARERQGPAAKIVASVAHETGAQLLDLSAEICPRGQCLAIAEDGLVRYRDGTHITVAQSHELAPAFRQAIAPQKDVRSGTLRRKVPDPGKIVVGLRRE